MGENLPPPAPGHHRKTVDVPEDYETLFGTLMDAFLQAASGKGRERHAGGQPWLAQPIFAIGDLFGPGFNAGQVAKKLHEAIQMAERGNKEAARREALGAIIYAASLYEMWEA